MGSCSFRADAKVNVEASPFKSDMMSPKNNESRVVTMLQKEISELRLELREFRPQLKRQEELAGFEKEK